ncbi:NADH-quinone oxidoreductase subunit N [Desulforhopalus sp. IMCC35007]|uniref:NADH-quinone oxidoreductase subunit N n=1 Tax=Desulforhopalus sp. IMCC35007 TaxID=2569543 RepID=UPI0010AEBEFA|nr:NADH-quinone oxidoreductase subunit N [Desulforhopalus sp. IMCC35007]TKB08046.1 NADH-quinone oxidoreductase subunit N [Desulforhopalus sp. IMCC35007]
MLFLPELTLLGAGLVLFFLSLGQPSSSRVKTVATTLAAITLIASLLCLKSEGTLFYSAYKVDLYSQIFKVLIALGTCVILIFSAGDSGVKQKTQSEYYLFLFMSVLGLMMLVSSVELLAIFISLELSSFAVYIMVPMRKDAQNNGTHIEAGIKYLLFGVMATGLMLFGMSYIYGLTGTTQLPLIAERLAPLYTQPAAIIAIALTLAGFFYKLALFPLHFWVPDVYEGASNETTAFIAAIPKLAAVAILIRVVNLISVDGQVIVNLLMVCALASMFYGNLSALVQKDVKRLLGFSGISHAGFVLVGLLTFDSIGFATAIYYITGYLFMNLACFLVICRVSENGKNVVIEDFTGLYNRAPLLSLTLVIGLFGLGGIPPFVGFTGKFMLLLGAFNKGYYILVILAAFNTAIAIYYYLSIVRLTFCTDPLTKDKMTTSLPTRGLAIFLMVVIVVMGIFPSTFISMASQSVKLLM